MKSSPHLLWVLSVSHLGLCPTSQVSGGSFMAPSVCGVVNSHPQTQRGLGFVLILVFQRDLNLSVSPCALLHIWMQLGDQYLTDTVSLH